METKKRMLDNEQFDYKRMLGVASDTKTIKSLKYAYLTGICYLMASNYAKKDGYNIPNTCGNESKECREGCLLKAGRGKFSNVRLARLNKTRCLLENRSVTNPNINAIKSIIKDIYTLKITAYNKGLTPCVRLNGTSDLPWHKYGIMNRFRDVQFYDYTKNYKRMIQFLNNDLPFNYDLTFSYTGKNAIECISVLKKGGRVAVVFGKTPPNTFLGFKVKSGDDHDLTFIHDKGIVLALKPKGKIKDSIFFGDH